MVRSHRQRSVIVLLLSACLLLQQLAMSALACTMPLATTGSASQAHSIPMSMSMSMAAMASMAPDCHAAMAAGHPAPTPGGVCEKHCSPDAASASTSDIPPVPALALPPLLHPLVLAPAPRGCASGSDSLFTRSDPPRLRYCRLLI